MRRCLEGGDSHDRHLEIANSADRKRLGLKPWHVLRTDEIDKQSDLRFRPKWNGNDADTANLDTPGNRVGRPCNQPPVNFRHEYLIIGNEGGIEVFRGLVNKTQCKIGFPASRCSGEHDGAFAERDAGAVNEERIRMHVTPQADE